VVDAETFEIAGHIAVGDYTDDVIGFGLRVKRRDVMPVAVSCLGG
jgi:hypothetical protein